MLTAFLEKGNELAGLSNKEFSACYTAFSMYLTHCVSFQQANAICAQAIGDDNHEIKRKLRHKLSEMIEDPYAVLVAKPALLRLVGGDTELFKKHGVNVRRSASMIRKNPRKFNAAFKKSRFPVYELSEDYIKKIELEYLEKTRTHSKRFAMSKARFLTMAENGKSLQDIYNDLTIIAIRSFRWYFPFRKDLRMLNTMRSSITNRGRGMLRYHVHDSRRRLVQLPTGESINIEATGFDGESFAKLSSADPTDFLDTSLLLDQVSSNRRLAPVVFFIKSEEQQDTMVDWASHKLGVKFHSLDDVSEHIRTNKLSYPKILSQFLRMPLADTELALKTLRSASGN